MAQKGFTEIEIKKLKKARWNYKTDDSTKMSKLVENMKRIGQVENLLIREMDGGFYEVLNGNHRLDALRELKQKKVMCFNFGKIEKREAQRIAIETNETKFESDPLKLAKTMNDLIKDVGLEEIEITMPYSVKEMEDMSKLVNFDWGQYEEPDEPMTSSSSKVQHTCPECGHQWTA